MVEDDNKKKAENSEKEKKSRFELFLRMFGVIDVAGEIQGNRRQYNAGNTHRKRGSETSAGNGRAPVYENGVWNLAPVAGITRPDIHD